MTTLQFYNKQLQTEFTKLFDAKCDDTKTQRTILNHIDLNLNSIEGLINNINKDLGKDDLNNLRRSVELISNNVKKHLKRFFTQCGAQSKTKVNKNLYNIIKVKLNLIKKLLKDKYNLYERSVSNSVNNSLNSVPDENENNLVKLDLNLQSSPFGTKAKNALKTKKARRGAFKLNVAKQAESEALKARYSAIEAENKDRRDKREAMKKRYAPIEDLNNDRRAKREAMEAKFAPIGAENKRREAEREAMKARYSAIEDLNNDERAKRSSAKSSTKSSTRSSTRNSTRSSQRSSTRNSTRNSQRNSTRSSQRKPRRRSSSSSTARRSPRTSRTQNVSRTTSTN